MESADLLHDLNQCLMNFKAVPVAEITEKYVYHPDFANSRLGSGSYGEAFRMRSVGNPQEPLRVVKVIPKSRVSRNALQIQHLCAELAVTGLFSHSNLNKRVGLYHNAVNLYIVLELVEGRAPDLRTRLAHLYATHHPARLANVDAEVERIRAAAAAEGCAEGTSLEAYAESSGRMRTILAEVGANKEAPTACDLFSLIVAMKRVPDGTAKVIIKQALQGLDFLHQNCVVHRDVKTENLVLGITRRCEMIYDAAGKAVGAKFEEEIQVKVIDFGLVKYMKLGALPTVMSPGTFIPAGKPKTLAELAALDANAFDLDDDPATAPPPQTFGVDVTPCGTELYCSLEVITGIIKSGLGRTKWRSDSINLPKMDVYGVGTMLFCCVNGRPPYRPPKDTYRPTPREERIRHVQRLIAAGPVFSSNVAQDTQDFIRWLMVNDPAARPSTAQALAHPYLASVRTNKFVYTVDLTGAVTVLNSDVSSPLPSAVGSAPSDDGDDGDAAFAHGEDDIMAAVRGIEDGGDVEGKEVAPAQTAAAAP